jgi:glycine cleavage system H protein
MEPEDNKYTKDHEWIRPEGDMGTVGLTNYAQEQLGDIVSVEFPDIGKTFSKGESVALIDSMKTTSELYAPVSGEVIEINSELESNPEFINEEPYGKGWIIKIKIKAQDELNDLMDAVKYQSLLSELGDEG